MTSRDSKKKIKVVTSKIAEALYLYNVWLQLTIYTTP